VNTINHLLKVNGYHHTDTNTLVTVNGCHHTDTNTLVTVNGCHHTDTNTLVTINGCHHTDTNTLVTVNGYYHTDTNTLVTRRQQHKKESNDTVSNIWAVFTCTGKDTRFVTKLFKEFKVNVSYRTKNTIGNILIIRKRNSSPYDESGVYQLKFQNCSCVYIGQTGRNFKIRYKEHIQDIKNNRIRTGFSHHILVTGHAYDKTENTMKIFKFQDKGVYKANKSGMLLNDNFTQISNPIFDLID
jgi:hypothetical protein